MPNVPLPRIELVRGIRVAHAVWQTRKIDFIDRRLHQMDEAWISARTVEGTVDLLSYERFAESITQNSKDKPTR